MEPNYGCEERSDNYIAMDEVILRDESGAEISMEISDSELYEKDINEGDWVFFDLDAKYIIHVSGPWWTDGSKGEEECLRKCYKKALQLATDYGCKSIVFPLLVTGTYGFPKELGIQIAIDIFTEFLEENDIEITLAVFGGEDVSISVKLVEDIASFIDDGYVEDALTEEYRRIRLPYRSDTAPETRMGKTLESIPIPSFLRRESRDEEES